MLLKTSSPCGRRRPRAALTLTALAVLTSPLAWGQGSGRSTGLVPTLDSSVNYVDTRRFGAEASSSEFTTEVRPGIQYSSQSGRLQGTAAYSLGLVHRSRSASELEAQHRLSAALTGALIENFAFVDVSASVSKQSLSAFGQQSFAQQNANNANQQEVGTLSISPSLRGSLAGLANYDLRLSASVTDTRKSNLGDSTSTGGLFSLNSANRSALLGWGLVASSTTTDFRGTGKSTNERATASLNWNPDIDLGFSLRGGRESTDIGFSRQQSFDTWGGSARWSPSPRTLVDVSADRRFFGRSHNISLAYRLPMSSLRFSSVRDVALSSNANSLGRPLTLFDLFFQQFASQEPDPVRRQQLVVGFLASLGLDPSATIGAGAINRGPTLQERNDIAATFTAKRLTLALQAYANRTRQLAGVLPVGGAEVNQRGYTGSASYQLTPTVTATAVGSRLMTQPTANFGGTDLTSLGLTLSDRIGRFATVALNARYTVFDSAFTPYRETALGASLSLRF